VSTYLAGIVNRAHNSGMRSTDISLQFVVYLSCTYIWQGALSDWEDFYKQGSVYLGQAGLGQLRLRVGHSRGGPQILSDGPCSTQGNSRTQLPAAQSRLERSNVVN
jgi:hypothetical protein